MRRTGRAARAALVVIAGAVGVAGVSPSLAAQSRPPRHAVAREAPPRAPHTTSPYTSVPVLIDPNGFIGRTLPERFAPHRRERVGPVIVAPVIYYYPAPTYGGQVYDATGRPLYLGEDAREPSRYEPVSGVPDLSGAPYVVVDGGAMLVDFGNGDRRTVPSCSALEAEGAPDGRSRTIFYTPPADAFILRAGARGRVLGTPPAGARVCYTVDRYGREALAY